MKFIDLFAGCGGFSTGFELAGFKSVAAIEKDEWASETFKANHPDVNVITGDITDIHSIDDWLKGAVDGVIGGPPCQGFSLSGTRDPKDPRNSLFMDFVRIVRLANPKFFVMENVSGILSMKTRTGNFVKDIIQREFSDAGYKTCVHVLNAAHFGVPQSRQRVFFIGVRDEFPLDANAIKPIPSHDESSFVTLEQAIGDLPNLIAGEGEDFQAYQKDPNCDYQIWVRGSSVDVQNHVAMRHTKRLVDRFSAIGYGQSVAHVSEEHAQRKRGDAKSISGKTFSQNNMRPYPDRPCPTVPASFQSNFIHPFSNRNFTAREGARIQSFPDTYVFRGRRTTMSWEKNLSQYQQIGNAVPPLLAKAIAERLKWYFENISKFVDSPISDDSKKQKKLFD